MQYGGGEFACTTELIARARARADAVKETIVVQDLKFVSTIRRVINKPSWRINTLVTEMGD
jgi:hypothetical protein